MNGDTYETLDYSDLSDLLGEDVEYEIESSDDDYISILVDESVGEEAYDVYNENNPAKAVKYYTDINSEHKSTREWAEFARENGYDGVIFRKLRDIGRYGDTSESADIYVAFNSNQFKDIDNEHPTKKADIRYSVADKNDKIILPKEAKEDLERKLMERPRRLRIWHFRYYRTSSRPR